MEAILYKNIVVHHLRTCYYMFAIFRPDVLGQQLHLGVRNGRAHSSVITKSK